MVTQSLFGDFNRYTSIDRVIIALNRVKETNGSLEEEQVLKKVIVEIFKRQGIKDIQVLGRNLNEILEKLNNLDLEKRKLEDFYLKEEPGESPTIEPDKLTSVVPVEKIRVLLDEYETYLVNGVNKDNALNLLIEKNKKRINKQAIESLIKRQEEISKEMRDLAKSKDRDIDAKVADEIIKTRSTEYLLLENQVANELPDDGSKLIIKQVFKEYLEGNKDSVKMLEGRESVKEIVERGLKIIDIKTEIIEKKEELGNKLIESLKGEKESDNLNDSDKLLIKRIVSDMITRTLKEEDLSTDNEVELMNQELKIGLNRISGINIEPQVKKINLELIGWLDSKKEDLKLFKIENFCERIVSETIRSNENLSESQLDSIKTYAKLTSESIYFDNKINKYKNESVEFAENSRLTDGQIENAWRHVKGITSILKMKPSQLEELISRYKVLKENLSQVKLPFEIKEVASFDSLMEIISGSSEVKSMVNLTQKFVQANEVINKFGLNKISAFAAEKIGTQAMSEFVKNSLVVFGEQGVKKGIGAILKGILSGGVKTVAAGGAGTAASGGVAAAVAAFQAIPIVGQVILVVVVAAAFIKKIVSPVFKLIKKGLRAIGINLDALREHLKDNLGDFFGGIANFLVKAGTLILGVPALISASSLSLMVSRIVMFTFIGIFAISLINSNLVSSVVPPIKIAEEEAGGVLPRDPNIPEGCPSGWPLTGKACITQGPLANFSHALCEGIDINGNCGSWTSEYIEGRPLIATVDGVVEVGGSEADAYGYWLDILTNCKGKDIRIRYGHLPNHILNSGDTVKRGQVVGYVDNSGTFRAPGNAHLHYEILYKVFPINDYLPKTVPTGCYGDCNVLIP